MKQMDKLQNNPTECVCVYVRACLFYTLFVLMHVCTHMKFSLIIISHRIFSWIHSNRIWTMWFGLSDLSIRLQRGSHKYTSVGHLHENK